MATRSDLIDVLANAFKASLTVENIPALLNHPNEIKKGLETDSDGDLTQTLIIGLWANAEFKGIKGVPFDRGHLGFDIKLMDCEVVGGGEWYEADYEWDGKAFKMVTDHYKNLQMMKVQKISGGPDLLWSCSLDEDGVTGDKLLGAMVLEKIFTDMRVDGLLIDFVAAVHSHVLKFEQCIPQEY